MPIEFFKKRMDILIKMIKETPRAKGVDQIYLPGEMEWQHREKVLRDNEIILPEDVVDSLKGLTENYDMVDPFLQ